VGAAAESDALVLFGATGDLAYRKIFPSIQALIRRNGLDVPIIAVGKAEWGLERLRERLAEAAGQGPPWVVYHRGAFGIEPVTYVLHRSAIAAAEHAVQMVRRVHDEGAPVDESGNDDGS
jgi:hypothetical protein